MSITVLGTLNGFVGVCARSALTAASSGADASAISDVALKASHIMFRIKISVYVYENTKTKPFLSRDCHMMLHGRFQVQVTPVILQLRSNVL